jgi:hypothetical protein
LAERIEAEIACARPGLKGGAIAEPETQSSQREIKAVSLAVRAIERD